jgi:adenylate cyclase
VELSMVFADVRGSTTLAEQMSSAEFSNLMNRFYHVATKVLVDTDAFIDKLVGDAVIGIYMPIFTGANHARPAIQAAIDLLRVTGHDDPDGPWIPVGVGVHSGITYFGTVGGAEGTFTDFTALGDNANVAARLSSSAAVGEALISESAHVRSGLDLGDLDTRDLSLKGKSDTVRVRVGSASSRPAS